MCALIQRCDDEMILDDVGCCRCDVAALEVWKNMHGTYDVRCTISPMTTDNIIRTQTVVVVVVSAAIYAQSD